MKTTKINKSFTIEIQDLRDCVNGVYFNVENKVIDASNLSSKNLMLLLAMQEAVKTRPGKENGAVFLSKDFLLGIYNKKISDKTKKIDAKKMTSWQDVALACSLFYSAGIDNEEIKEFPVIKIDGAVYKEATTESETDYAQFDDIKIELVKRGVGDNLSGVTIKKPASKESADKKAYDNKQALKDFYRIVDKMLVNGNLNAKLCDNKSISQDTKAAAEAFEQNKDCDLFTRRIAYLETMIKEMRKIVNNEIENLKGLRETEQKAKLEQTASLRVIPYASLSRRQARKTRQA